MTMAHIPVQEFALPEGGKLFLSPTGSHDVVAVEGSVLGGPTMLPAGQGVIPVLAAELLDAGTTKRKKNVLREDLAQRGISLSFSSAGDRTHFSGRCFPEDLSVLLSTIAECLGSAQFPEVEVKNTKALALGALAEEKSDTRSQAERAFAALVYDPSHTNYVRTIAADEKSVVATRRSHLQQFKKKLGRGGLVLAITGDIESLPVEHLVGTAFAKLGEGTLVAPVKAINKKAPQANEKLISIRDKANIDVLLGASIPLTVQHELYHPMKVVTEMLGGGFASHLMQTIRERDGLTYGVYAKLGGLDAGADGHIKIWATFSPQAYDTSVARLRQEVREFFANGLTTDMLAQKQEEMIGSYLVSLSTTPNLAATLHALGTLGFDLSYVNAYPEIIRAVSLADIRNASDLVPLTKFSLAASGTFPKS